MPSTREDESWLAERFVAGFEKVNEMSADPILDPVARGNSLLAKLTGWQGTRQFCAAGERKAPAGIAAAINASANRR
jgi:hypothetical protein